LKVSPRRKRVAISELMGTLIMVAVTLIAGAAVFGWINGQAGSSESAYGQSVANNVNFLNERFTVVTESFSQSGLSCSGGPPAPCNQMSFWVYNTGQVAFTLASVRIQSQSAVYPLNVIFYPAASSACSASSQACGFIAYNTAGAQVCSDTAAFAPSPVNQPGFYQNTVAPYDPSVAIGKLTSTPYQITMPTGATCSAGNLYLYDGVTYSITFSGLYGNSFSTSVTANG
jgi:flagellin-like protein